MSEGCWPKVRSTGGFAVKGVLMVYYDRVSIQKLTVK